MIKQENQQTPLDFLPEAMVDEMIQEYTSSVFSKVNSYLSKLNNARENIRKILVDSDLLKSSGEIIHYRIDPTVCGVDGAYAISRQLSIDVVGLAAVAVEGLPPYEKREWEKPHHIVKVYPVEHKSKTSVLASGLMFSFELELASKAPHNVVLIDGSLTTHLIKTGMAFSALDEEGAPRLLSDVYRERAEETLKNLLKVITYRKSDQIFVGVPKYSSRNEICHLLLSLGDGRFKEIDLMEYNDKALLSLIMRPDEIVGPIKLRKMEEEEGKWHLSGQSKIERLVGKDRSKEYIDQIISTLGKLYVIYYRPTLSQPALRIEIPENVAKNESRLAIVIKALQDQAKFPGIIEPYPLFVADLFVKHLGGALSQIKEMTLSDLGVINLEVNPFDVILSMHEYRSVGEYE